MAIATFNDMQWRRFFRQLLKKNERPFKLLRAAFFAHGFRDIIDHFKNEESESGKWPKRASSTQDFYKAVSSGRRKPPRGATRAQFNPTNKLLQLTGNLRKNFQHKNVKQKGFNSLLFFNPVKYSGIHDRGGRRGAVKIPQREFMWLSRKAKENIAQDYLDRWVK